MTSSNYSADEVWTALRASIEDRDSRRLAGLCEEFESLILENFATWQTVPVEIRSDRVQANAYAESLVTLAKVFNSAGKPELYDSLQNQDSNNPIDTLDDELEQAKQFINEKDFSKAIDFLQAILPKFGNWLGPQVKEGLARTQGLLGIAYAKADRIEEGILHTSQALSLCEEIADEEGIAVYTESLQKMQELRDDQ